MLVVSLGGSLLYKDGKLNSETVDTLSEVLHKAADGQKFVIVVGGGELARKYVQESRDKNESVYDQDMAGIRATRENGKLMAKAMKTQYVQRINDIDGSFPITVTGGQMVGMTTDAVAVLIAEKLGIKTVLNLSKVDYLYDDDPRKNANAKRYEKLNHKQLTEIAAHFDNREARTNFPFDIVACKLAQRSNITVKFVNGFDKTEVQKALQDKPFKGTIVEN